MGCKEMLPEEFLAEMRELLSEQEFHEFIDSYDEDRVFGLRYNPLKADKEEFLRMMPFSLSEIPWAEEGFYYEGEEQPGKHVYHEAGAYYIQEPSAMSVVQLLNPQPGERILDLCAAPGGKSTQIAGRMLGQGILISNEIVPNRSKILSQNIERMGVTNCVVTNESPENLATFFPGYFDRIVVDAPCSGEGMFRKDPAAITEWSPANVEVCAARQDKILDEAAGMLKPGGTLVYSTCTFSKKEDEECVERFLERNPGYVLNEQHRIWPHKVKGEGHFVARMTKPGILESVPSLTEGLTGDKKLIKELTKFLEEELLFDTNTLKGQIVCFGDQVYLLPEQDVYMKGLKIERPGLHLVTLKKNRMEPAHALAMAINRFNCDKVIELSLEEAARFIMGETVQMADTSVSGWSFVQTSGYSFGVTKISNRILKNHYPKGLRRNVIF